MTKEQNEAPKNPDVIRVGNIVEGAKNGQKPMPIAEAEIRRIVENIRTSKEIFEESGKVARGAVEENNAYKMNI